MSTIFSNFSESSVLIVGDIILDRYWHGSINRISPESPVPIVEVNNVINRPGGAANVAINISSLGGTVRLIGLTGIDEAADVLKKQFLKSGVIWDVISVRTYSTVIKLRVIACNQQLIRLDFEKNINNIDTTRLVSQVKYHIKKYKVLVLSDYQKGSLNHVEEIIDIARHTKIPIIVDPKGMKFSRYAGSTILTPNISEFESVVGFCHNEKILFSRATEILTAYNLEALLITRAEQGMTLFRKHVKPLHFPARSQEVYDVTGAGDTVVGVLSAALSYGESLERSCFLANLAAGIVVKKFGTSLVNINEMNKVIKSYEYSKIQFGILDELNLKKIIPLIRSQGEKIVLTNGVFDILHYGHISFLNDAKKLGDKLIVAVNSDESTRRLKGKNRPINSLKERMVVLASLSMVDWVIAFDEDTPVRLIKEISPDFLVKGGDYKVCGIDGTQEVINQGGQVCTLNFKIGYSSSKVINFLDKNI